jgi:formate hydrogenlyase subunit 6/NADH:ubiquinone oxidoreductase subunit I
MGYFRDSVRAMATTIRNAFRRPTTVHYPAEDRVRPDRYRTSFALVHDEHGEEACIGCLACERICPSRIIKVVADKKRESPATGKKRGYASDFVLDLNACIYCELCVQVCPTDAIIMLKVPQEPGFSREDLCLTMDKLYANEEKDLSWLRASTLIEMQDPKRGQPKPEKKAKKKATKKVAKKVAKKASSSDEAKKPAAEAKKPAAEAKKPATEAKAPATEAKASEAEAKKPETEAKKPETEAKKPETEAKKPETEARKPEVDTPPKRAEAATKPEPAAASASKTDDEPKGGASS